MVLDTHTTKAALQLGMVQHWPPKWVKNDYIQQSSVTQMLTYIQWLQLAQMQTDAQLSLMYKTVHNLVPIEVIKYVQAT